MPALDDLTGRQFEKLVVIKRALGRVGPTRWRCRCVCGAETVVRSDGLKHGKTPSCGCTRIVDLHGQRFGRLTVVNRVPRLPGGDSRAVWHCRCDCGAECDVWSTNLREKRTFSCGCLRAQKAADAHRTHGRTRSPEYWSWLGAKQRCTNPKAKAYPNYGGRGITMWLAWLNDFPAFLVYLGPKPSPRHTLDRIDSNGNYEPGNVRWALPIEQANNQRRNHRLTFNGETHTLAEWATKLSVQASTLRQRIRHGWSVERALSTPVGA